MADPDFTASRQSTDDSSYSTLAPAYEERLIILAQGKQFQNAQINKWAIPDYLQSRLPKLVVTDDRNMTYADDVQHVNFTIRRVTTKSDFMQALQTDGAHVVYCGHARLGQGPCFGDVTDPSAPDDPGQDWGSKTTDPTQNGIFRAGFPYIGIPINEICDEHQYTVSPVSGNDAKPDASDFHPHARKMYDQMQQFSVNDLAQKCKATPAQVAACLGDPGALLGMSPDTPSDTFWGYDATGESGKFERHVLLKCDWQNTDITPNDVGGVNITCKAFICIACSTYIHHYPIVRKLKGWTKDGDNRLAYWTTNATSSAPMMAFWLYRILTYPQRNDNQPWEPSLEYAKSMANRDYAALGENPSSLI